ncbi:hypothetical protein LCGC14_3009390 [marine sediment metagenome]|uniref:Uncharacterized protein n=1 Tax=marine sediment metagenome TaxID=412755 RepID=A0A0F8WZ56_9ZZZZ
MIKSENLILRKTQLREQKADILKQIDEMTADMHRKDLEQFIRSGSPGQVDGKQLRLLQRKYQHLVNLEGSLNLEVAKARKRERQHSLDKLNKKIEVLEKKRKDSLYSRYLHFQSKIAALMEEDKKIKQEILEIKSRLHQHNREEIELDFRLPGLQEFLKKNYVQYPDKLEQLVEKSYNNNELALHPGPHDISKFVRGYSGKLNLDSGKVTELKPLECDLSLVRRNPSVMGEVVK